MEGCGIRNRQGWAFYCWCYCFGPCNQYLLQNVLCPLGVISFLTYRLLQPKRIIFLFFLKWQWDWESNSENHLYILFLKSWQSERNLKGEPGFTHMDLGLLPHSNRILPIIPDLNSVGGWTSLEAYRFWGSCVHSISRYTHTPKECKNGFLPGCVIKLGVMDITLQRCVKNPLLSIFIPSMTQREVCLCKLTLLLRKHLKDTAGTCFY